MCDAEAGTFYLTDFLARNFERLAIAASFDQQAGRRITGLTGIEKALLHAGGDPATLLAEAQVALTEAREDYADANF